LADTDPELRHEVESMFAERTAGAFLDEPAIHYAAELVEDATVTSVSTGALLGPYPIDNKLGEGGMGEVYRAVDTRLGRAVAIKTARQQFSARFEREARTISSLNRPNICTVHDVGPNYLVMELVEGETIATLLKNGPLPRKTALLYASQILAAPGRGGCTILAIVGTGAAQTFHPDIPRSWDDKEVARFELPLAQRDRSPRYLTAEEYYALKVRPIYRTYPVYIAGREPAGYIDGLKQKEPEIAFDASKLRTKEDWVRAGEVIFEAGVLDIAPRAGARTGGISSPVGVTFPTTNEGVIAFGRYVVRQKGLVEVGFDSCAGCHVRILPDGTAWNGAQLDVAIERADIGRIRDPSNPAAARRALDLEWARSAAPWIMSREEFDKVVTVDELVRRKEAMQAGVRVREGSGSSHPTHIPSLIGLETLRYLDRHVGD
jgi:hypothetical protein